MTEGLAEAPAFLLEVHGSHANPELIELVQGRERPAMSFGKRAMWTFDAPNVLDVHGYVYFDGRGLYLQSAHDGNPVLADGRAVPKTWTQVSPPCRIEFGSAVLIFCSANDDDEETIRKSMSSMPASSDARPNRPFAPGAFASKNDDPTRVSPLEESAVASQPRPAAGEPSLPRFGSNPSGPAAPNDAAAARFTPPPPPHAPSNLHMGVPAIPPSAATLHGATPSPSQDAPVDVPMGPPPIVEPPSRTSLLESVGAQWSSASVPKRILIFLMPVLIVAIFAIFREDETAHPQAINPAANGSTHATVASAHLRSALPPPPGATTIGSSTAASSSSASQVPPASSSPPPIATGAVIPLAIATATNADRGAADAGAKAIHTEERAAADAVAAGSYAVAAKIYDALAATNPDRQVYREAARILREKLDAGVR